MPCWPAKWLDVNARSRPVGHAACGSGVMDDRRTSAGGSQVYSDRFLRLSVCLFLRVYNLLPSCSSVQFSSRSGTCLSFSTVPLHRVWYPAPSIYCQLVCFKSNRLHHAPLYQVLRAIQAIRCVSPRLSHHVDPSIKSLPSSSANMWRHSGARAVWQQLPIRLLLSHGFHLHVFEWRRGQVSHLLPCRL
jgi:hypothetical protein